MIVPRRPEGRGANDVRYDRTGKGGPMRCFGLLGALADAHVVRARNVADAGCRSLDGDERSNFVVSLDRLA